MKKLKIHRPTEKILGAVRCSEKVYAKLEVMSKKANVSKQEVLRQLLDAVIDEYEV